MILLTPKQKNILEWVYCIIIAVIIAILIRYFIGTPTVVKQTSMFPTLKQDQRLWLNRWTRTTKQMPKRGDIITFEAPSELYIKKENVDLNNPVAKYDNEPQGIFGKFTYYVLEVDKISFIKRVILNILTNSIKYTPENGNIKIYVGFVYNDAYIKVIDNGIGIPGEDLNRIFDRFYRVDKARTREMGGTGLRTIYSKRNIRSKWWKH